MISKRFCYVNMNIAFYITKWASKLDLNVTHSVLTWCKKLTVVISTVVDCQ